jgi:acyl-CoA thioesterase-1
MHAGPIRLLLSCLLLGAALTLHAAGAEPQTIVFFGDSLTAGYGLENPNAASYPTLIQKKIDAEKLPWRVVNSGLSGETTAGGLRRVDWILRQPVDLFVLALGANDGLRGISPAVSKQNLEQILTRVRTRYPAAVLVIAGMQMPPQMGPEFTAAFGRMYPDVAEKFQAKLIPFLLANVGAVPELNQGDGIHPNPAGHALVAENVWKVLRPLL